MYKCGEFLHISNAAGNGCQGSRGQHKTRKASKIVTLKNRLKLLSLHIFSLKSSACRPIIYCLPRSNLAPFLCISSLLCLIFKARVRKTSHRAILQKTCTWTHCREGARKREGFESMTSCSPLSLSDSSLNCYF